jgi:hypothetical protein
MRYMLACVNKPLAKCYQKYERRVGPKDRQQPPLLLCQKLPDSRDDGSLFRLHLALAGERMFGINRKISDPFAQHILVDIKDRGRLGQP